MISTTTAFAQRQSKLLNLDFAGTKKTSLLIYHAFLLFLVRLGITFILLFCFFTILYFLFILAAINVRLDFCLSL